MSTVIDLCIVGIIAICTFLGYRKGLTGSLIKILSFVLSLVIAFVLFVPVSNLIINNTQLDEQLETSIREFVAPASEGTPDEKMPTVITEYINQKIEEAADTAREEVADAVSKDVAQTIVKAGTWIALFIVARIALIMLKFVTGLIAKLPVIKQFNKAGGIIYGVVEGLLITYFILAIVSFVTPMTSGNLSKEINKSYIGSQMYHNNLLLNIIF